MNLHLVFSSLKRWLVLWVTTDKKISAGVAACGVSVFGKKKVKKKTNQKAALGRGLQR